MKKKNIPVLVFSGFVLCILLNNFIQSYIECKANYNFVITKIEVSPTNKLILYNNKKKIRFWNYIISDRQGVKAGDLLHKKSYSKYMYVYKKNMMGKYSKILKVNPTGLFPVEYFCDK
ncbi:hypothetical protein AR687_02360 [Flavobacteriaceae bacterium CRH]|nr:hypothetical protein AR687_02360 [Flavobacteriaceae bacterium CRH]